MTFSFRPATQIDIDTLISFVPEGPITNLNQLPQSMPANLIRVIPELKVNGVTVKSGEAVNLGVEFDLSSFINSVSYTS